MWLSAGPLRAIFWVDEFASEARLEELCVGGLCEAKAAHVLVVATERVAARAKREAFAEVPDFHVVVAAALFGRQGHLVRPLPIDRSFAQFAFAVDHSIT